MAYQRLAHPHGEQATAFVAAALGARLVLNIQASMLLEDVARAFLPEVDRGPLWFQLYLLPDRGFMQALVQRTEAAGFEALVLTVDAPVQGARDRERRAGFRRPADVTAVNLTGRVAPVPLPLRPGQSRLFDDLMTHAPTWDDIAWLRSITPLPVLLKGVVYPVGARSTPYPPPPLCCRVCCKRWQATHRWWWMAASAAAPTCSRPWRWAPLPCSWAGRCCTAWPTVALWVWPTCCACFATSWRLRWR
jgi:hypothetical protein